MHATYGTADIRQNPFSILAICDKENHLLRITLRLLEFSERKSLLDLRPLTFTKAVTVESRKNKIPNDSKFQFGPIRSSFLAIPISKLLTLDGSLD
jgi:hypothetical protein